MVKKIIKILFIICTLFLISCDNESDPKIEILQPLNKSYVAGVVDLVCKVTNEPRQFQVTFYISDANRYPAYDKKIVAAYNDELYRASWDTWSLEQGTSVIIRAEIKHLSKIYLYDEITVTVDHSVNFPDVITINTVEANLCELTIAWSQSTISNFSHYTIYTTGDLEGEKYSLAVIDEMEVTEIVISQFDYSQTRWVWLSVSNSHGFETIGDSVHLTDITPAPDPLYIPDDCSSIQDGIVASAEHGTIIIAPGTYYENLTIDKNLVIASSFLETADSTAIEQTVIDGGFSSLNEEDWEEYSGSVIDISGGLDSTTKIIGLTITNGFAVKGAGINCRNSSPQFLNLNIYHNWAGHYDDDSLDGDGAGVYIYGSSSPLIENCIISNNFAWRGKGGGVFLDDGADAIIKNTIIKHNYCEGDFMGGVAGLYSRYSSPVLINVKINRNTGGGAVFHGGSPYLKNVTIIGNDVVYAEAAGILFSGANPICDSLIVVNNRAYEFEFGGLALYNGQAVFRNIVVAMNHSGNDVHCGISLHNAEVNFENLTTYNNYKHDNEGIGFRFRNSIVNITNSIIWEYFPIYIYNDAGANGSVTISYSDVRGGRDSIIVNNSSLNWGPGNIDSDPLYCDPENNDFRLTPGSPCIGVAEDGSNIGALGIGCD